MSAAYGVHFGCSSACIAVNKDDKTDVIANDLGDRTTPCVVAFTDHDQAVGAAAKQGMIRNIQNTVCHVKQVLGKRCDDPAVVEYRRSQQVNVHDKSGEPIFEVDYKESRKVFTPTDITVLIFKKLLETAQSHGGSGIQDSVIAVPLNFTPEQRRSISVAASQAGFNVLRLISEPAAAILAFDIGQADVTEHSKVLVLRLGGVSTDATVVNVQNGMYQIMSSLSDSTLGGDKFTTALSNYLITEFKRQSRCDISDNKRSMAKLNRAAEMSKHSLSKLDNVGCSVDSLYDGIDFNTKVSRARFESCISDLVQRCTQLIDSALSQIDFTRQDINKVILCGGGCNIPLVRKSLTDMFSHCEILNTINPEEVIAVGAAKQAGFLSFLEDEDIRLNTEENSIDSLSKAISIKVHTDTGVQLHQMFPVNSPLHSRKHLDVSLAEGQSAILMEICEVESTGEPGPTLGKIVMRNLPQGATLNTTFHLRRDGHLHVTCCEPTTAYTESLTLETS